MKDFQNNPQGTWNEWARYVLLTIEKLEERIDAMESTIGEMRTDIRITGWKIGIIVAIASVVGGLAVNVAVELLIK